MASSRCWSTGRRSSSRGTESCSWRRRCHCRRCWRSASEGVRDANNISVPRMTSTRLWVSSSLVMACVDSTLALTGTALVRDVGVLTSMSCLRRLHFRSGVPNLQAERLFSQVVCSSLRHWQHCGGLLLVISRSQWLSRPDLLVCKR